MPNYNLFLDDERQPRDVKWIELPLVDWLIVRSHRSFVDTITKYGLPQVISFDHDLAEIHYKRYREGVKKNMFDYLGLEELTGYDSAKYLVDYCLIKNLSLPKCYVHTLNPIGKDNIESILNSFLKFRESQDKKKSSERH